MRRNEDDDNLSLESVLSDINLVTPYIQAMKTQLAGHLSWTRQNFLRVTI